MKQIILAMQKYVAIFIMMLIMTAILGCCTSDKSQSDMNTGDDYITGEVQEIQQGRDGYTARISTDNHQVYFANINIPNLGENARQSRKFEVGETISVKGDGK